MIRRMKLARTARKLVLMLACALLPLAGAPATALAQEEVDVETDGRFEGYGANLTLGGGNNAMLWFGFAFVSAIALLALFKDAKRSHLD